MKRLTLLQMTLTSKSQGGKQKTTNERDAYCPPPGSLRSPSGTLRGKTNDESFIQNIQLSPVLMLPSHTLRDISCFNDFKTLKSKSQKLKPPSGQTSKAKALRCAQLQKHKSESLKPKAPQFLRSQRLFSGPFGVSLTSASLRSETKALKMKGLKGQGHLSAFGHTSLLIALGSNPDERLAPLGDISLKDESA